MTIEPNSDVVKHSICHCFAASADASKSTVISREEVPEYLKRGERIWCDIEAPTREDTAWLGEVFDFHELALTDVMNNSVRPKQESYGEVLFTVVNAINLNEGEDQLNTINLNIFLTERFVVSTHLKPLKTVREALRAMDNVRDPLSRGADYQYYKLLDGVVNRYLDVMDEVDESIDTLERRVFGTPGRSIQEEIFREKRRLAYLRRSVGPTRDAIRDLVHNDFPQIRPEVRMLLRDVLDHVLRIGDAIESYRELSSGLMDSYMTNISNRMNEVMKLMSIIATVMLPLSFLTGIFGMNFDAIPGIHAPNGFWILVVLMSLMVVGLIWFFRRKGIM